MVVYYWGMCVKNLRDLMHYFSICIYHRSLHQFSDKSILEPLRTYRAKTDQTAYFDHITITDKVLHAAAGAGVLYQISTLLWNTLVKAFSRSPPPIFLAPLRDKLSMRMRGGDRFCHHAQSYLGFAFAFRCVVL